MARAFQNFRNLHPALLTASISFCISSPALGCLSIMWVLGSAIKDSIATFKKGLEIIWSTNYLKHNSICSDRKSWHKISIGKYRDHLSWCNIHILQCHSHLSWCIAIQIDVTLGTHVLHLLTLDQDLVNYHLLECHNYFSWCIIDLSRCITMHLKINNKELLYLVGMGPA